MGFPDGTSGKESTCQCRGHKRHGFDPWVGKIPWRRAWQPTPVFLPGESHGQKSMEGYSPWGHKELDMTELLSTHTRKQLSVSSYYREDRKILTCFSGEVMLSPAFSIISRKTFPCLRTVLFKRCYCHSSLFSIPGTDLCWDFQVAEGALQEALECGQ